MIMCERTDLRLSVNSCCLCVTVQRRKFLRMKRQKYGYIYRTHLFGNPTVRVTGADNVRQILLGEHRLVSAQWPASVRTILGSDTLSNVHGAQHKTKKKVSGLTASSVLTGQDWRTRVWTGRAHVSPSSGSLNLNQGAQRLPQLI